MRADRLLSLMLLLHHRGRMTAQQLAGELEVSERTIYRDIDALSMAGVPIYTQTGTSGGIFLDENYRISLTGLSRAEVRALFVPGKVGPLADLGLDRAMEDTLLKLFAALPTAQRDEVARLRQRFHIDPTNWFQLVETSDVFPALQQAVWEDRRVKVTYQPVEGRVSTQTIDAYALVAKANIWYLVGRKPGGEMRNYRISRFQEVALTDEHFIRDPDFDLATYWRESCEAFERKSREAFPPYVAILRVHYDVFWVFPGYMEGRYEQIADADADGWLTLRVVYDSLGEARMRVLGLGAKAEVVEPDELRKAVIDTARAVVAAHAGG